MCCKKTCDKPCNECKCEKENVIPCKNRNIKVVSCGLCPFAAYDDTIITSGKLTCSLSRYLGFSIPIIQASRVDDNYRRIYMPPKGVSENCTLKKHGFVIKLFNKG